MFDKRLLQVARASVLGKCRILGKFRENLIGRIERRWSEQVFGVFFALDRAVTAICSLAGTGSIFSVPSRGLSTPTEWTGVAVFLHLMLLLEL